MKILHPLQKQQKKNPPSLTSAKPYRSASNLKLLKITILVKSV